MKTPVIGILTTVAMLALIPTSLEAQGWIEPAPARRPTAAVVKVRTAVRVSVAGRIAQVEVEEWFRNDGGGFGEGDYLYPLPGEAVFGNFSLSQGDQELRGETMDAAEARAIYEEIVRRKRDPALVELVGQGLLRARVFPINPGQTRKITMRYTQMMNRAGDALQFRYAAGGRHRDLVEGAEAGGRPGHTRAVAPLTFEMVVDDEEAFGDPFSPTHRVQVERRNGRLRVRPEGSLSGDFALFLPFAHRLVGLTLATHRPSPGEPGFFMLTLSPARGGGNTVRRDVTAVVDVSGSMSGSKLQQAKSALRQLLATLNSDDRFRLISFSNNVTAHRPRWARASEEAVEAATRWIDDLEAGGGTNIAGALEEAFRLGTPEGRLPVTVFLTDGLPSVGEKDPELIAQRAGALRRRTRVFAFGVGYDVNTHLLDRLTAEGRGATQYVEPGADVEDALSVLSAKIQHPVLTDLELASAPVRVTQVYPRALPDLFAGEELVLFGRYDAAGGNGSGVLSIRGVRNGRAERYQTDARFPGHELDNDYIPRLWASRKLGFLTRTLRLEGPDSEIERDARETAMRYGLLSEFTSYLVQEPDGHVAQARMDRAGSLGGVASRAPEATNGPSPVAKSAVGRRAVLAAEESRRQREIRSEADLDDLTDWRADQSGGGDVRYVAGRPFRLHRNVWTDLNHADSLPIVDLAPFGESYFRLLQLAPELQPWLTAFETVLIAGARRSIRVVAGGADTLGKDEMAQLVRDFRGL